MSTQHMFEMNRPELEQTEAGLILNGICKEYRRFRLEPVYQRVPPGRIVALVGRNGAGKTTLLKTASGILQPDAGEVILNGTLMIQSESRDSTIAKSSIGYLPEQQIFYEWMTVARLLDFCSIIYPHWRMDMTLRLLDRFELDHEQRVGELSKGMRVKLGLIVALSHAPQALLLDEPLTGLDPMSRATFMRELDDLVGEMNCCCLVSSHDIEDFKKVSDSIWVLKDGKLSFEAMRSPGGEWESNGVSIANIYEMLCEKM